MHAKTRNIRRFTLLSSLVLASTVTACGGDSTGPSESYSGTYTLRTINGKSLPYVIIQVGANTVAVLDGVLTVTDNGTDGGVFTLEGTLRTTESGQVSQEAFSVPGSYTRNGTTGFFSGDADGPIGPGTIGGGKVTFTDEDGFSYAFKKP